MEKLLPLWLGIERLLHWGIEWALAFFVGAPVQVGSVLNLHFTMEGKWYVKLRGVRVGSTLKGDSLPVASLREVSIWGEKQHIDSVYIWGGEIILVRLGKHEKNFRFFLRRGRHSIPQSPAIYAESLSFHLANFPPSLFLHTGIKRLHARLQIDSLLVQIQGGQVELEMGEVCLFGGPQPFPEKEKLYLTGTYEKYTDAWRETTLILLTSGGALHFKGDIFRWEFPHGSLHLRIGHSLVHRFIPAVRQWLQGGYLFLTGEVSGLAYEARLQGAWRAGGYDICLKGEKKALHSITGEVSLPEGGYLHLKGTPRLLAIRGSFHYRGITAWGRGSVVFPAREVFFLLRDSHGTQLYVSGAWQALQLSGKLRGISFQGEWMRVTNLHLRLDTVAGESLYAALQPYSPFFQGENKRLTVTIEASLLTWGGQYAIASPRLIAEKGEMVLSGYLHVPFFPTPLNVKLRSSGDMARGMVILSAPEAYLQGEWKEKYMNVSGMLLKGGIFGTAAGEVDLSARHLWLRKGSATFPTGEEAEIQGRLTVDSADVEVKGSIPLVWILDFLPIGGVEVSGGVLNAQVCAQGKWDTLFRRDNPTEGTLFLTGIRGGFPRLGVPLHDLSIQVSYTPQVTRLHHLEGKIGTLRFKAYGEVAGALSYLYTDWYRLHGRLHIQAESLILSELWRRVERGSVRPLVRFPSQLEAEVEIQLRAADILGIGLEAAYLRAEISGLSAWADSIGLRYGGATVSGRVFLDLQDSACYFLTGKAQVQNLPIEQLIADLGLRKITTFEKVDLHGRFSGSMQVGLRFTPEISWLRQSSLLAEGQLTGGRMRTPNFLRWFRPYYLAAYRDTVDFFSSIGELSVTDGFLRLSDALLVSRIAAFQIAGYHYLPGDRFLYRIQAARVRRRLQRYPSLMEMTGILSEFLDRSVGLLYIEKEEGKVRWRYPWRYLLRRLLGLS